MSAMMLKHSRFSHEVARLVFPYLDKSTALALSSTRRDLRCEAPRWALCRPVLAATPAKAESFVQFIQGGSPLAARSRFVTVLSIALPVMHTDAGRDRLINALITMTSLVDLRLLHPEAPMAGDTRLVHALADLRSLTALSIIGAGPQSKLLLSDMLSRPTAIEIVPRRDECDGLFSVCGALAAHSNTVVRLSLGAGVIPFDSDQGRRIKFSTVRHLTLSRCVPDCGGDWMLTFPNVSVFNAGAARPTLERGMLDVRDRNSNAIHTLKSVDRFYYYWRNISLIRGGVIDTFIMGNECRTSVLQLDGVVGKAEAGHLVDIVDDCEPRTLRMTVSPGCCLETMKECEFGTLEPLGNVRGLAMRALVKYDQAEVQAGKAPLGFVRDIFNAFNGATHVYIILEALEQDSETAEFLRKLDLPRLATRIARVDRIDCEFLCVRHGAKAGFCQVLRSETTPGNARACLSKISLEDGRKVLLEKGLVSAQHPLEM